MPTETRQTRGGGSLYLCPAMLLKPGDRVFIDGTHEEGAVTEVHPHEIVVRLKVPGGYEDRRFAREDLRLEPILNEASNRRDFLSPPYPDHA
jgi:hypothetical protein